MISLSGNSRATATVTVVKKTRRRSLVGKAEALSAILLRSRVVRSPNVQLVAQQGCQPLVENPWRPYRP